MHKQINPKQKAENSCWCEKMLNAEKYFLKNVFLWVNEDSGEMRQSIHCTIKLLGFQLVFFEEAGMCVCVCVRVRVRLARVIWVYWCFGLLLFIRNFSDIFAYLFGMCSVPFLFRSIWCSRIVVLHPDMRLYKLEKKNASTSTANKISHPTNKYGKWDTGERRNCACITRARIKCQFQLKARYSIHPKSIKFHFANIGRKTSYE